MSWPRDVESQLRLLVRAYPVHWREQRGDELVGTVSEMLGPRPLSLSLASNIVLGGWKTRLREHPPLRRWLIYLVVGRPMPERWRAWAYRDITARYFPLRRALMAAMTLLLIFSAVELSDGATSKVPWGFFAAFAGFQLVMAPILGSSKKWRRQALKQQRLNGEGIYATVPAPPWPKRAASEPPRDADQLPVVPPAP